MPSDKCKLQMLETMSSLQRKHPLAVNSCGIIIYVGQNPGSIFNQVSLNDLFLSHRQIFQWECTWMGRNYLGEIDRGQG